MLHMALAKVADNVIVASSIYTFKRLLGLHSNPPGKGPFKVFSAGLSRTGTSSLQAGLEQLGYKTFHGSLADEEITKAITVALFTDDASQFLDLLQSRGYDSSAEYMLAPMVRTALARYPDARVVLSVRDTPEAAVASFCDGIETAAAMAPLVTWLYARFKDVNIFTCALSLHYNGTSPADISTQCNGTYQPVLECSSEIRAYALHGYNAHNAAIRALVPPEQLLEFNVKQGYGPLCSFLAIPEADCPAKFPHVNDKLGMKILRGVFLAVRYGWWVPLLLLMFLLQRCHRVRRVDKLE